jgi:hypothetical protein
MWSSTQNVFVHVIPYCDFNINNIYIIDKFICVKMDNQNLWLKYQFLDIFIGLNP